MKKIYNYLLVCGRHVYNTNEERKQIQKKLFYFSFTNTAAPPKEVFHLGGGQQNSTKNKNNKEDKLKQVNRSVVQSRNAFSKLFNRVTVRK